MKQSSLEPKELSPQRKAFLINLDADVYGTIAEIGAGQEVARHFFKAGGASGTLAKSMSAYDMKFSDSIYGKADRYVSKTRVAQMLEHEYKLLIERLCKERGEHSTFFVYANTVAAASYSYKKECHGWMGTRFQITPKGPYHDIIAHVRLLDYNAQSQQDALGAFGVNLIWASLVYHYDVEIFMDSLLDGLGSDRIEVDQLQFDGPEFSSINNRLVALKLVEHKLTHATLFDTKGEAPLASEAFYKKSILVQRGSFRPLTNVNIDIMECAKTQFIEQNDIPSEAVMPLFEITMQNALAEKQEKPKPPDCEELLQRVELINATGYPVLISDYPEYYRLSAYFRRYAEEMLGMTMGISHLMAIFDRNYYQHLDGGILEAFGRLFKENIKLYIYPSQSSIYKAQFAEVQDTKSSIIDTTNIRVPDELKYLYLYLIDNHIIEPVHRFNLEKLSINPKQVLEKIASDDPEWKTQVPEKAAAYIQEHGLWKSKS